MTELDTADGIDARDAIDPPRIWLQNAEDANHVDDRLWCAHPVWPDAPEDGEPVEYIRIDLHNSALRSAHEVGKREGIGVLREARGRFNVEYADDGRVLSVSHAGGALRSLVAHLDAAILSLSPSPTGSEPDWCYLADDWECAFPWTERRDLVDDATVGEPTHVRTLVNGPDKWAVWISGDDGPKLHWFDSEAEAVSAALPAPPADGEGSR